MASAAVRMRGLAKSFGGVRALDGVDFELRQGEVLALAGGNGAGKSTLMKILQGVHQPDQGTIEVGGKPVRIASARDAMALGIAMIFQEFSVVPSLTVAQNTFLGRERRRLFGLLDDRSSVERTRKIFADMGVSVDPDRRVEDLSTAYWQLTEIAKALSQRARVLIMDEPTASLAKDETERLFGLIRSLTREGISVVYISHRLDEIFAIADRVMVLRDGKHVATMEMKGLTAEELIEQIVGRRMENALEWRPREVHRDGPPLLQVRNLRAAPRLRGIDLDLHPGEILGLAGLMGSGRSETVRALFGIDPIEHGEIRVRGREVAIRSSRDAIRAGIALVPEDRRVQGLVLDHSVRANLLLPLLPRLSRGGWLDDSRAHRLARELSERLNVKSAGLDVPVQQLSGGNQQKVVLAKWMGTDPDVYLLDEPTAGVDIGTKVEIVDRIRQLADEGKGVIFVSSEFPEMLAVCDRLLVLRDGTTVGGLDRRDVSTEETLHMAVQGFRRVS